jgi:hypothetical protein
MADTTARSVIIIDQQKICMRINGKHYQTVWMEGEHVCMIDQTLLPFELKVHKAVTYQDCCHAIKSMIVRGAGAIGAVAGYAMALACLESERSGNENIREMAKKALNRHGPLLEICFMLFKKFLMPVLLLPARQWKWLSNWLLKMWKRPDKSECTAMN